jgi:hypothetical protein
MKVEGSTSYGSCWTALNESAAGDIIIDALARARVIQIDKDQVEALPFQPYTYADVGVWLSRINPPFPEVFLDLGGASMMPMFVDLEILGVLVRGTNEWPLSGPPVSEGIHLIPFFRNIHTRQLIVPGVAFPGAANVVDESGLPTVGLSTGRFVPVADAQYDMFGLMIGDGATVSCRVLAFLESANLELREARLSKKRLRAARRNQSQIALTVYIRSSSRSERAEAPGTRREFSHRFEVRGHYKLFAATSKMGLKRPELLSWVPERQGFFRRVWCPPFIVGPPDKPLIPKRRVLVPEKEHA